jgi:hypothetical protein
MTAKARMIGLVENLVENLLFGGYASALKRCSGPG